jgi:hypothetical protein
MAAGGVFSFGLTIDQSDSGLFATAWATERQCRLTVVWRAFRAWQGSRCRDRDARDEGRAGAGRRGLKRHVSPATGPRE